jgi:hypothetical protein
VFFIIVFVSVDFFYRLYLINIHCARAIVNFLYNSQFTFFSNVK